MGISNTIDEIETLYGQALGQYLAGGGERALRAAYEVGRLALARDVGLLDLAELHHSALTKISAGSEGERETVACFAVGSEFLTESLSAYEMAFRGYREAVAGLRGLNQTLEQEVKRIAHTVHDEAGQLLVVVHLALADIAKDLPPASQGRIKDVANLLHEVEDQLRGLSHELRPTILDDLGLIPAARFLADRVSKRSGLTIQVNGELPVRLLPATEIVLYRIIQEGLNNIAKHSQARYVWIELGEDVGKTACSIRDDGVGFDFRARLAAKGKKGLGLIGIQERLNAIGGTLQIRSERGRGTLLLITVPKENSDGSSSRARR